MVHLVRNSLDHGLETPELREEAGKSRVGKVTLNAFHQGGNIVIEIMDDGAGLNTQKIKQKAIQNGLISESDELSDDEINELIFMPGFSTKTRDIRDFLDKLLLLWKKYYFYPTSFPFSNGPHGRSA